MRKRGAGEALNAREPARWQGRDGGQEKHRQHRHLTHSCTDYLLGSHVPRQPRSSVVEGNSIGFDRQRVVKILRQVFSVYQYNHEQHHYNSSYTPLLLFPSIAPRSSTARPTRHNSLPHTTSAVIAQQPPPTQHGTHLETCPPHPSDSSPATIPLPPPQPR